MALPLGYYEAQALMELDSQDTRVRLARQKRAWEAYNGEAGEEANDPGSGMARLLVLKSAGALFGQPFTWTTDAGSSRRTPEEEYLTAVLRANQGGQLLLNLAINGGVSGDAWLAIRASDKRVLGRPCPRLLALTPAYMAADWTPDDVQDIWRYTMRYPDIDRATGRPMEVRQVAERQPTGRAWLITDSQRGPGGRWQQVGQVVWPYPFSPYLHCQNLPVPNTFWGEADLDGITLDLIDNIGDTWENLLKIMEIYAHPLFYGTGLAGPVNRDPKSLPNLPPGATLNMLQAQGVSAESINVYLRLMELLHETSEIPAVATGKLENAGALSGTALKILYGPLIQRTQRKRLTYGDMLCDLGSRLLALGGFGADIEVDITWPAIVSDPLGDRQQAEIDARLGVSAQTILEQLGYDAEREILLRSTTNERPNTGDPGQPGAGDPAPS